jgi:hypothetical protein
VPPQEGPIPTRCYELMDLQMNHREGEERIEVGGEPFSADDQAAVLALEPCKRPLGLVARDIVFDRPSPPLTAFPDSFGYLGANAACAEATAEVFGIIALIRCQDPEPFARSALFPRADVQGIQQREDLGPLVPIRGRGARGQRHARGIREAMDEEAFTFPAIRNPLTAAFARGKTSHPRRRTATESSRAPQPARVGALAWQPACHQLASAATRMRGTLGSPLGPAGEVTPAAAGNQDVEQRIHHLTKGGMRHATTSLRRRRKHIGKELPLQVR